MKSKKEIKKWLLENCVNEDGNLDLIELDFSDFDGDVILYNMIVKKDLYQGGHKVEGDLYQNYQKVKGDLYQSLSQEIKDTITNCINLLSQDGHNTKKQVKNILIKLLEENE